MKTLFSIAVFFFSYQSGLSQDTLPRFSVRNVGNNRIVIGWINAYPLVKQISIQRSFDSVNYKTILSVADPNAVQNGYVDAKAPNDHMYYRLFILLDGGNFLFSPVRRPVLDTASMRTAIIPDEKVPATTGQGIRKPEYVPSVYVYTNKDGYVFVNLPDADQKKYRIRFYEEGGNFLFELKNIRHQALTLDKANFLHAGWFKFELFNDDKLVEQNKFYLTREF